MPPGAPSPQGGGSGSKKTLFIVLGVVGVGILLLIFASVLAITFLGDDDGDDDVASTTTEQDDDETTTTDDDGTGTTDDDGGGSGSGSSLPAAEAPGDFDDEVFDALGATCEEGRPRRVRPALGEHAIGSEAEAYGATCGGRQTIETPNSCTTEYEWDLPSAPSPGDLGDDDELDALAADCQDGDLRACDDLTFEADTDSGYERYGRTCGGRLPSRRSTRSSAPA